MLCYVWGVVLQGCSTEGLYGLARICEMLCYDGGFKEYFCKGLHGIATDLILKETNNVNFWVKVNLHSFDVAFLIFYSHLGPISADLDDLPLTEFSLLISFFLKIKSVAIAYKPL